MARHIGSRSVVHTDAATALRKGDLCVSDHIASHSIPFMLLAVDDPIFFPVNMLAVHHGAHSSDLGFDCLYGHAAGSRPLAVSPTRNLTQEAWVPRVYGADPASSLMFTLPVPIEFGSDHDLWSTDSVTSSEARPIVVALEFEFNPIVDVKPRIVSSTPMIVVGSRRARFSGVLPRVTDEDLDA